MSWNRFLSLLKLRNSVCLWVCVGEPPLLVSQYAQGVTRKQRSSGSVRVGWALGCRASTGTYQRPFSCLSSCAAAVRSQPRSTQNKCWHHKPVGIYLCLANSMWKDGHVFCFHYLCVFILWNKGNLIAYKRTDMNFLAFGLEEMRFSEVKSFADGPTGGSW